jgi:hypothetical protein
MRTPKKVGIAGLEGGVIELTTEELADLNSRVEGPLLRAGDEGWDDAVRTWNGMVATVPALVAQPKSPHDVAAAVRFARDHELRLSVKGGGHHIAGTSIAERGLTLDMSRMREIGVDPHARLAHVGPGCLLKDVDRATQEHGLATVLGFISEVGVAGLTLGGGLGYLTRRFGWTVDNLIEVEVVTADGRIRRASRDENPDLFWAMRGAGANFGAVTRFTFRLHPLGPTVYGGLIAWPFERANEILKAYRTITTESCPELSVWLMLMHAPPMPFVADDWQGKPIGAMAVCYSGNLDRTEQVLARSGRSVSRSSICFTNSPTYECSPTSTRPSLKECTTTGRRSISPRSRTTSFRRRGISSPSALSPRRTSAFSISPERSTSATPMTGPSGTETLAT